ncbi:unnamed protein product [Rotaria socialis]|uniref:Cobalamin-independent methionine synthase MetE C-terminal/archaeal domain-containing protein n=1 Tax=Rotaria socialis TaxID=392032 RepID=A0A817UEC5_9BILA|nr:unnamed protein product [Rotaria socialis]CAF3334572.1 unnamed protein product [Rotaria socialis]CAF3373709.1 unnamed protein product [Rotaria socialis]CAF4299388.1 unnamed protein product [Rotaria socialis]CAF4410033.1 unnamed protein product [Rotaria socialis]
MSLIPSTNPFNVPKPWITIPTELIGSLPRTTALLEGQLAYKAGHISLTQLDRLQDKAVRQTLLELEKTGPGQITDGEQAKPNFLAYPIAPLYSSSYSFDDIIDCFTITFSDRHQRSLPRLTQAPFRYGKYAVDYLCRAQQYTRRQIKQAVISPSALSNVYPRATISGYSRDQFLDDLVNETEKDIRLCLELGADIVQMDFTEARLSLKMDPSGQILKQFIQLNNRVLDRFLDNAAYQYKIGVHVCPGGDRDSHHSLDVDYSTVLPSIFDLHVSTFYLSLASERDRKKCLTIIRTFMKPYHRIFLGVIDPNDARVETAEQVCDRVLEAARFIPIEQLGTTDDCGFSPFSDDESTTRSKAYDKIRARVDGTRMAERILNSRK